jgi:hypothetical protein
MIQTKYLLIILSVDSRVYIYMEKKFCLRIYGFLII